MLSYQKVVKGGLIRSLFGKSPFGLMVRHAGKVHDCLEMIRPLMEALKRENYIEIQDLQNHVSKLEYEADKIKQEIRGYVAHSYFLPVERSDLQGFLNCLERMADYVKDFAVILVIRKTKLHPELAPGFTALVDQVLLASDTLVQAAEEMVNLADSSFGGAESKRILSLIEGLGELEWKADRLARKLSKDIYALEGTIDVITIMFYEKLLMTLSSIANEAENGGDFLRIMLYR